jgi:hypothetical protein
VIKTRSLQEERVFYIFGTKCLEDRCNNEKFLATYRHYCKALYYCKAL